MPPRRTVRRRRPSAPGVPEHLLDAGGLVPAGPERLWPLLAWLTVADPARSWHDPLYLLTVSGEPFAEVTSPGRIPAS